MFNSLSRTSQKGILINAAGQFVTCFNEFLICSSRPINAFSVTGVGAVV